MEYLKDSRSIHVSIHKLFSTDHAKWAVVAFVGANPMALLPKNIKNLHVICWPEAGGTHPDGIRQLIEAGIKVSFCENMHIKLFYCEGLGVIVGSANLSARALLSKQQHEFAVFVDDPKFDIQSVLKNLGSIVPVNAESLAKLDIEHNVYSSKNPSADLPPSNKTTTFQEAMSVKFPKKWKLVTFISDLSEEKIHELEEDIKENYGSPIWKNYNEVDEGRFTEGDFVLQVKVKEKDGKTTRSKPEWLYVDYVARVSSTPVIVELRKTSKTNQPFAIDKAFERAFKSAFNAENDFCITDSDGYVTEDFIKSILAMLSSASDQNQ